MILDQRQGAAIKAKQVQPWPAGGSGAEAETRKDAVFKAQHSSEGVSQAGTQLGAFCMGTDTVEWHRANPIKIKTNQTN